MPYGTTATLSSVGGSGTGTVTFSVGASTGCNITSGTTLNVNNVSGTCIVTATKAADTNYNSAISVGLSVTLTPGALDHFSFAFIPSQTAGESFLITIAAKDAGNNTITNYAGTVDLTVNAGTITPVISGTFISGQIIETVTVTVAGTLRTITATDHGGTKTGTSVAFTVNNPIPTTTLISPTIKSTIDTGFTLTVNGTNFISGVSTVNFNGSARVTTFVSSTQLTASILTSDLAIAGSYPITVTNTTPGGGTSNAQTFIVNPGVVDHFSFAIIGTKTAGVAFNVVITAKDYNNATFTTFTGTVDLTTNYGTISPTLSGSFIAGVRTESIILTPGSLLRTITATDHSGGGATGTSNTFTVNNPIPTTTSILPTNKTAGDSGFTLTVDGTNFVSTSIVNFNGSARTTTYVSSTQLTASILAGDLITAGTFNITVTNPGPGGGTSNAEIFTVGNIVPITTSILPTNKTAGDSGFTLTVNGTNFISGSVVKFNGVTKTTNFISSTQLSATILTADLLTAGTFLVVVENASPGGGDSNAQIFTVHNVIPAITNISSSSKPVGSTQFILTVNGTNFLPTSVVNFGGSALATTYISATQLTAIVSVSYLTTAGTFSITVYNPSTLETSNSQSFTVGALGRHEFNYSRTFYGSGSLRK